MKSFFAAHYVMGHYIQYMRDIFDGIDIWPPKLSRAPEHFFVLSAAISVFGLDLIISRDSPFNIPLKTRGN